MNKLMLMDAVEKAKFLEAQRKRKIRPCRKHGKNFMEWSEDLQAFLCILCGYKKEIRG